MKKRRSRAGAAALEGKLYVCGGHDGQSSLDSVEIFNPDLNQWTSICSMRVARCKLGMVAFNGRIFAVGGKLGHLQNSTLKSVESFDPKEDEWCPSMSMQSERSSFGIAVLENEVLVVGGLNWSKGLMEAEILPESGFWHQVAALDPSLFGMSCCTVLEMYFYTAALFPRGPIKGEMPLALKTPQH
ncbi:kelch-like protein 20 [Periophthalmus magnuspinnatus]|uniref:kelch-like protein 20 n=1 Tax=Periophthalmus magnuspinnatus TaxID=409849 RepID=UPI0024364E4E|nr:kelch-like protein 20 [Periophthalmus magnuspinnatus]